MKKSACVALLVCLCATFAVVVAEDALVTALRAELHSIAATMPGDAGRFASGLAGEGEVNVKTVAIANVEATAQSWHLPAQIVEKFKMATFSTSMAFETFNFALGQGQAAMTEYIGAARHINETLDMAYLKASSHCGLVTQYDSVKVRHCHHCWGVGHCCHDVWEQHARGLHPDEMLVVQNALRAKAFEWLNQHVVVRPNAMLTSFEHGVPNPNDELAVVQPPQHNDFGKDIKAAIEKMIEQFPELKKKLVEVKTEVIDRLVGRGFTSFQQATDVQLFEGVPEASFEPFVALLQKQLAVPEAYQGTLGQVLRDVRFADSNAWLMFRIAFQIGQGAQCRYVQVLCRHDTVNNRYDWMTASVSAAFALAPDLLVVRKDTSYLGGAFHYHEDKVVLIPHALTMFDMEMVFSFFDVVTFTRFAEVLQILPHNEMSMALTVSQPPANVDPVIMSYLAKLVSTVGSDEFGKLIDHLKSSSSSTYIGTLIGRGFRYFEENAQMQKVTGLVESHLEAFQDELRDRLEVPDGFAKDFKYVMSDLPYMDSTAWTAMRVLFNNAHGGGKTKFVSLLMNHDVEHQKYNFLICNIAATFDLAPDIFIIRKAKSYAGGIYSSSEDKLVEKPRGLTPDDLQAVFDFFEVVAYERFAKLIGMQLENPPLK